MGRIRADFPWRNYLPNLYCNGCEATVSVADGSCPAGHPIRPVVFTSTPGRHRAKSRPTRPLERLALSTVKAISTLKPSEDAIGRGSATTRSAGTPRRSEPAIARLSAKTRSVVTRPPTPMTRPARAPAAVLRPGSPTSGYSGSLGLPFVEMFGFDGDNEVLSEDDFLPVVTAHAPSQVLQITRPATEAPLTKSIRPTKLSLFDSIPRLSEVGAMTSTENTGTLVERLWEATGEIEALEGSWNASPSSLSTRFQNSDHRWGLIGASIVGLILIIVALSNLGEAPVVLPDLDPARQAVQSAVANVEELTAISGALADPNAPTDAISGAAVDLAVIDRAARDLATAASSFASTEGYEAIASALSAAADQGSAIEARLGDALSYRLVSDTLFILPPLPSEADGTLSAQISFDLAAMVSDAERAVQRLPRDPALTTHRLEAERLVQELLPLIDRYLEGVRNGDAAGAQLSAKIITDRVSANRETRAVGYQEFDAEIRELSAAYRIRLQAASELLTEIQIP